jgi:CheY-like chemotaxis protein
VHSTNFLYLLKGKRILVVEDEYFLADDTRKQLVALDAEVVGPTGTVDDALELIETSSVDGAILDVHLGDELVFSVAERLDELSIPFVFATGYDPSIVPEKFSGFTLCKKPTELGKIAQALFGDIRDHLQ